MPRFLESNYLIQYKNQRQILLNNYLLGVPHHLDQLPDPSSKEKVTTLKERIGLEGPPTNLPRQNGLDVEADFFNLNSMLFGGQSISQLETLGKQSAKKNATVLEVIPSSNPDSPLPDSFDSDFLADWGSDVEFLSPDPVGGDEDINANDLCKKVIDDQGSYLLEDVESDWSLLDLTHLPTTPSMLSCKLRPVRVADPFLMDFGNQESLLLSDRELDMDKEESSAHSPLQECVQKIEYPSQDGSLLLEEPMSSIISLDQNENKCLLPLDEIGRPIEILNEENDAGISGLIAEDLHVGPLIEGFGKRKSETDDEFREIEFNILIGQHPRESSEVSLRLDSPLSNCAFESFALTMSDVKAATEPASLDLSPLSQRHFASTTTNMVKALADGDKYLDNTLSMTLKVPDSAGLQGTSILESLLKVYSQSHVECETEVLLPWDPLMHWSNEVSSTKKMIMSEMKGYCKPEKLSDEVDSDIRKLDFRVFNDEDEKPLEAALDESCNNGQHPFEEGKCCTEAQPKDKSGSFRDKFMSRILERMQACKTETRLDQKTVQEEPKCFASPSGLGCPKTVARPNMVTDSPLDTFMLLRTGEKVAKDADINKVPIAMVPPRSIVKAAKVKPSVFKERATDEPCNQLGKIENTTPVKAAEKEQQSLYQQATSQAEKQQPVKEGKSPPSTAEPSNKNKMISVDLPTSYVNVLRLLEKDSRPLLGFLRERRMLGPDYQFYSLNPDVTRFLLRQQEKIFENSTINGIDADVMKGIICLHALVLSFDAVVHYGIPAAIGVLKHIREKYEGFVGDLLETVRKQLAKQQYRLDVDYQLHPKIERITRTVQDLTSPSSGQKIMILVRRYFDYCYASLEASLRLVKNAVIKKYPNGVVEEGQVHEVISQANVIVAELSPGLQFCPWNRISFVIEFEYKEESEWSSFCFEKNPHIQGFLSFGCCTGNLQSCQENVSCFEADNSVSNDKPMKCFSEHIVIGSSKVTENKDLLSELENRLNLTVIERDYSQFYHTFGDMGYYLQPDVIVDERTAIMLLYESELTSDASHAKLANIMSSMAIKCLDCYIIAVLFATKASQFPYNAVESLSNFKLILSKYRKVSMAKFHLVYAFSNEETADWIFRICNTARDASPVWALEEWGKRFWLTEEMSMHEQFLLSFPMFTSFTAQIALTATSLKALLGFTIAEMKNSLKWIPERTIEAFHSALNDNILGDTNSSPFIVDYFPEGQGETSDLGTKESLQGHREQNRRSNQFNEYTCTLNQTAYSKEIGVQSIGTNDYCGEDQGWQLQQAIHKGVYSFGGDYVGDDRDVCAEDQEEIWKGMPSLIATDSELVGRRISYREREKLTNTNSNSHLEDDCYGQQNRVNAQKRIHSQDESLRKPYSQCCYSTTIGQRKQAVSRNTSQPLENAGPVQSFPKWRVSAPNSDKASTRMDRCEDQWFGAEVHRKPVHKEPHPSYRDSRMQCFGTPSTIRLAPSKKRRLTFERDPQARDGQTRLTFL